MNKRALRLLAMAAAACDACVAAEGTPADLNTVAGLRTERRRRRAKVQCRRVELALARALRGPRWAAPAWTAATAGPYAR